MFEDWFKARLKEVASTEGEVASQQIEHLLMAGKILVDYLMLQLNGISLSVNSQKVEKAQNVQDPP